MYLLSADILVCWLGALCDLLDDGVSAILELHDGVLQLCSTAELLGGDTVLQRLFSLQNTDLHLC